MKTEKRYLVRFLYALIGNVILAMGAAMLAAAALGADLYTGQIRPVANLLGMPMGFYQMLFSIVLGAIIYLLNRKLFGAGSLINIFLVGFFISFFIDKFGALHEVFSFVHLFTIDLPFVTYDVMLGELLLILLAMIIYSLGISMYANSDMGAGPYDGLGPLLVSKTGWGFVKCRMLADGLFLMLCIIFGYIAFERFGMIDPNLSYLNSFLVGPSTIIAALCLGPFINFWTKYFTIPSLRFFGYDLEKANQHAEKNKKK